MDHKNKYKKYKKIYSQQQKGGRDVVISDINERKFNVADIADRIRSKSEAEYITGCITFRVMRKIENGKPKIVYLFGDFHVPMDKFTCDRTNPTPNIANTWYVVDYIVKLASNERDKVIDIFAESCQVFDSKSSGKVQSFIHNLGRVFSFCTGRTPSKRQVCYETFGNVRYHHIDPRSFSEKVCDINLSYKFSDYFSVYRYLNKQFMPIMRSIMSYLENLAMICYRASTELTKEEDLLVERFFVQMNRILNVSRTKDDLNTITKGVDQLVAKLSDTKPKQIVSLYLQLIKNKIGILFSPKFAFFETFVANAYLNDDGYLNSETEIKDAYLIYLYTLTYFRSRLTSESQAAIMQAYRNIYKLCCEEFHKLQFMNGSYLVVHNLYALMNLSHSLEVLLVDVYTVARMMKVYESEGHNFITQELVTHSIICAGEAHTKNIGRILEEMGYETLTNNTKTVQNKEYYSVKKLNVFKKCIRVGTEDFLRRIEFPT